MRAPDLRREKLVRTRCAPGLSAFAVAATVGWLLVAAVTASPAWAQTPPAPKVCKECQGLADSVEYIQSRIDQTLRSQASMRKYANLQDPNVQQALKDDDAKVASLQALLAREKAKLAKCVEDKCKPPQPPPPPPPST